MYQILMKCSNGEWQVSRRFSEFDQLLTGTIPFHDHAQ
jgi:uncharacterized cupin superfamily protein